MYYCFLLLKEVQKNVKRKEKKNDSFFPLVDVHVIPWGLHWRLIGKV